MPSERLKTLADFTAADRAAMRDVAQKDFYHFARWMFWNVKGFQWRRAQHHELICKALMRVYRGECTRLIINIPPRYSKTELVVVMFMAWCMGRDPDSEFIHTSYSGTLAVNNAFAAKQIVEHDEFKAIFPNTRLRRDSKSKGDWRTEQGGVVYAQGSGGTITGFGAGKMRPGFGGAILIDDPHKADEARSDTMRKNVIEWFGNTLESRKNDPLRTPIILIMQRLHEKDLAGFLLDGGNGEHWERLILPAINPDGTALWPEKHPIEVLRVMEQANPYVFAGQYEQRPSPASGGTFKPAQMPVVDAIPAGQIDWVRSWDLASTTDGDFTAGPKLGKLPDGRFIIADMERHRVGPDERDAVMMNVASRDGRGVRIRIPQDPGQAGKTQALYLTRQLSGYSVTAAPESGDKVTRAEPFASQVNVGNVLMLRGTWNEALVEEMRSFPNGSNDDQIDALSGGFALFMDPSTGMLEFLAQQVAGRRSANLPA